MTSLVSSFTTSDTAFCPLSLTPCHILSHTGLLWPHHNQEHPSHPNLHSSPKPLFAFSSLSPLSGQNCIQCSLMQLSPHPPQNVLSPQTIQKKQSEEGWSCSEQALPLPREEEGVHAAPLPASSYSTCCTYFKTECMVFYTSHNESSTMSIFAGKHC